VGVRPTAAGLESVESAWRLLPQTREWRGLGFRGAEMGRDVVPVGTGRRLGAGNPEATFHPG